VVLGARRPALPTRLEPDINAIRGVIEGAVGSAQAVALFTETTLECAEAEPVLGLNQKICKPTAPTARTRGLYFVSLLSDADGSLHLIDAQVAGLQGAGRVDGLLSFFRDNVTSRLTPAIASDPGVDWWLSDTVDGTGSADVGSVHLEMDLRIGRRDFGCGGVGG
jgi:hypothetical protein